MTRNKNALAAIAAMFCATAAQASGYLTAPVPAEHRKSPLEAHIWYPSAQDGADIKLGKNAVFLGSAVRAGATPKDGKFPVVVLSHGSGGNAANLSWIAAEIADQGVIVLATNHPGTTSGDSHPLQTIKLWERPADVSALIDFAQAGLPNGLTADLSRVASVGFSLGGYTALASGGAQVSKADYISYCDNRGNVHDCRWFKSAGVDLNTIEQGRYEQTNRDPRITAVVAIDPAVAQAFQKESLQNMDLPVQIINLGEAGRIPPGVDGVPVAAHLPNVQLQNVPGATHFSFLGLCTRKGWFFIKAAGEDPICTEIGKRSREDIHGELKSSITGFLAENL